MQGKEKLGQADCKSSVQGEEQKKNSSTLAATNSVLTKPQQ